MFWVLMQFSGLVQHSLDKTLHVVPFSSVNNVNVADKSIFVDKYEDLQGVSTSLRTLGQFAHVSIHI